MIHPYVQQTFTEQLLPILCQAAGGEGRAQTKSLPPQLTAYQMISQRKHPCRMSFQEQATCLLHPNYHEMRSIFKYEF